VFVHETGYFATEQPRLKGCSAMVKRRLSSGYLIHAILLVGVFSMLFPFLWMVISSFKSNTELLRIPITFFPEKLTYSGYRWVWEKNIITPYFNTIIVALSIMLSQLITSSMAAYALARLDFPGKKYIFFFILCMLMVPQYMTLVTKFKIVSGIGFGNTLFGIILPNCISITVTFFLRQGFLTFPKDLEDAAVIDGCSRVRIFIQVLLPLQTAIITAMSILILLFAWNDLLWPLLIVSSEKMRTLAIFIALNRNENYAYYGNLMAAAVCAILPIIVVYAIFQKAFVSSVAMSGIKG
jgi:multiple sugar transport system permease protein